MQPDNPHAEYIRALVDEAPPLTDEQARKLGAILKPAPERTAPVKQQGAA